MPSSPRVGIGSVLRVPAQLRRWAPPAIAAVVLVAATLLASMPWTASDPGQVSPYLVSVTDLTPRLGAMFHPGGIQGFGTNSTSLLIGGVSVFQLRGDYSLPELAALGAPTDPAVNLTPLLEPYFHEGGIFGLVWNGTSWLVTGQATWGQRTQGTLVSLTGNRVTNLTPLVERYFDGGGIWIAGENSTSWLLGGNSSEGAALVGLSLPGGRAVDYSGQLPSNHRGDWVQIEGWNGTGWVVGGLGVFGALEGGRYVDLLPDSPFPGSGALAVDWNGTGWLVGGGPPAAVVGLEGDRLRGAVALPSSFDRWVNAVVAVGPAWLLAGEGSNPSGGVDPQMELWKPWLGASGLVDLTGSIPGSFDAGQVQYAAWAPALGPRTVLLVGQGDYDVTTGQSVGAVAAAVFSTR